MTNKIPHNVYIKIRKGLLDPDWSNRYQAIIDADHWKDHAALHLALDDPSFHVREGLVHTGIDSLHDKLVYDKDKSVRMTVAEYGEHKHHLILMHDPNHHVRAQVAYSGNSIIREKLKNDPHPMVRGYAKNPHGYQEDDY